MYKIESKQKDVSGSAVGSASSCNQRAFLGPLRDVSAALHLHTRLKTPTSASYSAPDRVCVCCFVSFFFLCYFSFLLFWLFFWPLSGVFVTEITTESIVKKNRDGNCTPSVIAVIAVVSFVVVCVCVCVCVGFVPDRHHRRLLLLVLHRASFLSLIRCRAPASFHHGLTRRKSEREIERERENTKLETEVT